MPKAVLMAPKTAAVAAAPPALNIMVWGEWTKKTPTPKLVSAELMARDPVAHIREATTIFLAMERHPYNETIQEKGCYLLEVITRSCFPGVLRKLDNHQAKDFLIDTMARFQKNKAIFNLGGTTAFRVLDYEKGKLPAF